MAVMIDHDIEKFGQTIVALRTNPSDELLRQKVHETPRSVWFSAMDAATLYAGVIEDVGLVQGKTRAQLVKEGFEEAIALMSPIQDDYLHAIQSRWDELKIVIEPAICHTA